MTKLLGRLVIIGAGGHGRVVADIAEQLGYDDILFVDSDYPNVQRNLKWRVVGKTVDDVSGDFSVFVAIGNCQLRQQCLDGMAAEGKRLPILIHPSACVSSFVEIGEGTVIMPNAVVNAAAKLGKGVIVNTGATIDHDCIIGHGVHISPGVHVAGAVTIGDESWIGIGSSVRERIQIGSRVVVGTGSAVVKDVDDGQIVMGVPAKQQKVAP